VALYIYSLSMEKNWAEIVDENKPPELLNGEPVVISSGGSLISVGCQDYTRQFLDQATYQFLIDLGVESFIRKRQLQIHLLWKILEESNAI
jgi:hypothetical protein